MLINTHTHTHTHSKKENNLIIQECINKVWVTKMVAEKEEKSLVQIIKEKCLSYECAA